MTVATTKNLELLSLKVRASIWTQNLVSWNVNIMFWKPWKVSHELKSLEQNLFDSIQLSIFYCCTYKLTVSFNLFRHPLRSDIGGPTRSPFIAPSAQSIHMLPTHAHSTPDLKFKWQEQSHGLPWWLASSNPHLLLEEGVVQPVLKNVQQRELSAAWDSVFCFLMGFPGRICFWNQIAAG